MMCKSKIKKGDEVIIIAGKDIYKKGKVLKLIKIPAKGIVKVCVEGINILKKHVKPNPQINEPGGIKEKLLPIDISNVMLYNPDLKKGDRISFKISDNKKKERLFKKTGELVLFNEQVLQ